MSPYNLLCGYAYKNLLMGTHQSTFPQNEFKNHQGDGREQKDESAQ